MSWEPPATGLAEDRAREFMQDIPQVLKNVPGKIVTTGKSLHVSAQNQQLIFSKKFRLDIYLQCDKLKTITVETSFLNGEYREKVFINYGTWVNCQFIWYAANGSIFRRFN